MTLIDRCLLFLVCSPILVFIIHIITGRIARHFGWRVATQKLAFICIVFGNLPVGLLIWFYVLQYADRASQFWGGVYCILVYNALGHIYFHLFNLTQTGIRTTIMRDVAAQKLTIYELINRYDPSDSGERMQRLLEIGVVKQVDDRYFLQTQWLYYVGIICKAWGNLLGFSEKDNGYISSVSTIKHDKRK